MGQPLFDIPPYKLPPSDPMEGGSVTWLPIISDILKIGQVWAIGRHGTFTVKEVHHISQIAVGIRSFYNTTDASISNEFNTAFYSFSFFAGHNYNQERRPVLWEPKSRDDSVKAGEEAEIDDTVARVRLIEIY